MKAYRVAVLTGLLALNGCGGGGSGDSGVPSNPAPTPPPSDEKVSGIWQGSLTGRQSGVTNNVACVITQAEEMACLLADPSTGQLVGGVQGTVSVANGNQVSGSGSVYAVPGVSTLSDGSTFSDFTITSGTVDERISLDLVAAADESVDVNMTFNPLYDRGSSLAAAAGVYIGFTVDGVAASFSIDGNGEIFAQSQTGCIGNGQISAGNPQFNEYSVTMTVSNCPGENGVYNGLAVTDDFAATDDELDFAVFADQQAIFGAVVE